MAGTDKRGDRHNLIEKLRHLVAHPATSSHVRDIAKDKLAILSPRNPEAVPGSPRRRETDVSAEKKAVIDQLVEGAWMGINRAKGRPQVQAGPTDKRFYDALLQEKHILDILA